MREGFASPRPYPIAIRLIHWSTAGLIATQLCLVGINAVVYEGAPVLSETLVQGHIWIGVLIMFVTVLRGSLRLLSGPAIIAGPSRSRFDSLARAVHLAMYLLIFVATVTGYLKLAWLGYRFEAFGLAVLPSLDVAPQAALIAKQVHSAATLALVIVATGHALVAIWHYRLFGTHVLWKMKLG